MIRLSTSQPGFAAAFDALVSARREADADLARDVRTIIAAVRDEGDAAVAAYTRRLDRFDLDATGWRIERADMLAAWKSGQTARLSKPSLGLVESRLATRLSLSTLQAGPTVVASSSLRLAT